MIIVPDRWAELQHYKDRSPPWIKLHRNLLDDYDFQCLPDASRALAPMLWIVSSEYERGEINADLARLSFRVRRTESELQEALKPLIEKGFFLVVQDASTALAGDEQDATLEERQRERKVELEASDFDTFWEAYPKKKAKKDAQKAWLSVNAPLQVLLLAIQHQCKSEGWAKANGRYIPMPASWLRGRRWEDVEVVALTAVTSGEDPALKKITDDRAKAVPMPPHIAAQLAAAKAKAAEKGVTV